MEPGQVTRGNASSTQVGYANPPPEYRFKTGVSGNPNGRPRKLRPTPIIPSNSVQHVAMAEARREITIRENDGENRVTALEAIMRSMVVGGVKGNRHMQAALVSLLSLVSTAYKAAQLSGSSGPVFSISTHSISSGLQLKGS
jgi:hypothetical protein